MLEWPVGARCRSNGRRRLCRQRQTWYLACSGAFYFSLPASELRDHTKWSVQYE